MDLHVVPTAARHFAVEYLTGVEDNFMEVLFCQMSFVLALDWVGKTRAEGQPSFGQDMSGRRRTLCSFEYP